MISINQRLRIMSDILPLYTKQTIKGISLFSAKTFKEGEIICKFDAKQIVDEPSQKTVQINEFQHIFLLPDILQYTNHHCDPNIYFNVVDFTIDCIKDIAIDDEITFFYPSTEWSMSDPFECKCGAINCVHIINGAKYMDKSILSQYKLAPFIQELIELRKK